MSDVLSQSEIDELFKALNSGDLDVQEMQKSDTQAIKVYDFSRPSKFSKEQLRTLEIIYENYARLLSNYLSSTLRKLTTIEVVSSEAVTYYEFTNSLSNPVIMALLELEPLEGTVAMEMSPNLGYGIIDRTLGGTGDGIDKLREFTDIETLIIERVFSRMVDLLIEPWYNVIELSPRLNRIESNPQMVQLIAPNEIVALITLSVKIGDLEGMMNVCLPHIVIEPIIDKLNTKYWFAAKESKTSSIYKEQIETAMGSAKIPIKAVLGKTVITVQEFLGLQRNDVIKLDKEASSELDVYVGNILKFRGIPGTNKDRNAIKISDVVRRGDE